MPAIVRNHIIKRYYQEEKLDQVYVSEIDKQIETKKGNLILF